MDPILGQIILWAGTWVPQGWLPCDGRTLPVQTNAALFSLLGATYGGDGRTTFALPDLRGRVPVGVNPTPMVVDGIQISQRALGSKGGVESVANNLLAHTHQCSVNLTGATAQVNITASMPPIATNDSTFTPTGVPSTSTCLGISPTSPSSAEEYDIYAQIPSGKKPNVNLGNSSITVSGTAPVSGTVAGSVSAAGNSTATTINTMQPFEALYYIIATEGIYPQHP